MNQKECLNKTFTKTSKRVGQEYTVLGGLVGVKDTYSGVEMVKEYKCDKCGDKKVGKPRWCYNIVS